jgi:hypothetical protein
MAEQPKRIDWDADDAYWKTNFRTRPYAVDPARDYDYYQPGYRYGFEAANRYQGREWNDIETDLARDWDRYEHRNESTWEHIKHTVRDAWDRVTGRSPVGSR